MQNAHQHTDFLSCDEMLDLGMAVPEILERLEDDLGSQAVWKLTSICGGHEIHIPQKDRLANSVITKRLGKQIADWLNQELGHGRIIIPIGPASRRARNMAAFRSAFAVGKPHREIAMQHHCHIRTVGRAKSELKAAGFL